MINIPNRCSHHVWTGNFHTRNCKKPVVVTVDGKPYCKVHNPSFVEEKRQKAMDEYNAEIAKRRKERERSNLEHEYCKNLSDEELKTALGK